MKHERTFRLNNKYDEITLVSYHSNTWDVLVGRGEEEDYHVHVVATFDRRRDAQSFVKQYDGGEYLIGIRPPLDVVRAGIEWLTLINADYIETVNVK